ncbi:xanthine dehydrogenase family protein molybdopterin-binding subunit [Chelatococcus asaccharovorans]|uniref:xanthine dehydrogenase family protein molybdopterin-binding subunit n=1 Tax=Chelatococcus asaccharovorans TaxID=28210 RepID=UPI00224C6630|nr:xanthine dehydrogenase family protein molybdopterin-binding subunit [Chelatococcus asaccharovorans]CAH1659657.1 Xanthine dehydrogenase, molybdenum binding subunit [Chelatococcus asaccharovorans]CAH1687784.1 Xanthine dehydrogenase, molybdenum binding subunit [Chelatococcus asaccharovorans]
MTDVPFPNVPREDARQKVCGAPIFGTDSPRPGLLHAALAVSTIPKGRILDIDTLAASATPGVRQVLTHQDLADLQLPGFLLGGYGFQNFQPLRSPDIAYRGQPIAVVVADTFEAATEAAALVRATYAAEAFCPTIDSPGVDIVDQADTPMGQFLTEPVAADADAAFAAAPIKVDIELKCPAQHQNPIELIATVAEWEGDTLIVHEGTQNAEGVRHGLARVLGIPAGQVEVISPFVGGGFGQKSSLQMQTALAAAASRRAGAPVKLVVPRTQLFQGASFRPASRHHVRLGADVSGTLLAAIHETDAQSSRIDFFPGEYAATSARLYGWSAFRGLHRLIRTDTQTPGFMRAPFEHPACFAMETAMDELAYAIGMDPVDLRLANDTILDPITKRPFSSRHAGTCLRRGAERFGWQARSAEPRSMRSADGSFVGWGVALGAYPGMMVSNVVRLTANSDGGVEIAMGAHEMGQGMRSVIAAVAGRKLRISPGAVTVVIGDTRAALQQPTAGSWGSASAALAIEAAADAMWKALAKLTPDGVVEGRSPPEILKAAARDSLDVETMVKPPGQPDDVFGFLRSGLVSRAGPVFDDCVSFSFIAHFVEVHVEPRLRRVRVPRVVSVADCGRVISPRTALSQVRGGVVWGIGAALREASETDPRYGGFLNADLAEYAIPVNADIGRIDVEFIDEPDGLLESGVKSLGEVSLCGVAPAIANAVFHATGRRLRELPIRIEHVM